ncbi:methyltransferase, FkbM family [Pseudomonas sp. NFACC23-1]|uniref:FkbM family methyltransferase n=1 Tax=unclassified Pseudomonas TaxID=196821 RepID=UPI00087ED3C5|nr:MULTISPECIES: FkbM family methyltransferase [unclassified Pseudomonas]SDB40100.1 methyltransferase, FkbM family [Pseudomonas sp. NFACC17-2]SEJ09207.1 methyltransferase, FkbM family [Pseudomonas sp. NFACC23-1]SFW43922.1 methyltransferase, FkbM family [Pseudomonas sp. NFACC16-2]
MLDEQNFKHVLVYGARLAGQRVQAYLADRDVRISAFLDRDASLDQVDGIPVASAQDWAASHDPASACVIIGLFNNYVDVGEVVAQLQQLGYGRVVSLVEFVRHFPEGQPFRYWLVDPRYYEANADRIAHLRENLADETSRELLDRIVDFRITGDYLRLPAPSPRQYFPEDLPTWPQPLRFIDCGAYTGDTVEEMRASGLFFEAVATFEPNLENYAVLVKSQGNLNAVNFPCGVSDGNRQVGFDGALGAGGHLVESGGETVTCVRLDDALPGFAPTLIKMDIEGEEPAALEGALQLLRQYRPNLAVSIYHRAEHLWSIFEQIDGYGLGYRFFLRCHAHSSFDTVLYAVAPNDFERCNGVATHA